MWTKLLITCEHGGQDLPPEFADLFGGSNSDVLNSHRGWDIGALDLARTFVETLPVDFHQFNTLTRLLIDFNRAPHHPRVFSEFSQGLSASQKLSLFEKYYEPYRLAVVEKILNWHRAGEVILHLSIHSFTPIWEGRVREIDVGILFDPRRPQEKAFSQGYASALKAHLPQGSRVAFNRPYKGQADGFTTHLRHLFQTRYLGIELETNQALWTTASPVEAKAWRLKLAHALRALPSR